MPMDVYGFKIFSLYMEFNFPNKGLTSRTLKTSVFFSVPIRRIRIYFPTVSSVASDPGISIREV